MLALIVTVEIQITRAVKAAQTLHLVLHRMGVYDIHNDSKTRCMGIINQMLQLLGSAEA